MFIFFGVDISKSSLLKLKHKMLVKHTGSFILAGKACILMYSH